MKLNIGDMFQLSIDVSHIDNHAWVVISHPDEDPENVVMVNLTTFEDWKDDACILISDDHSWIKHRTCISYEDATMATEGQLDKWAEGDKLKMLEAASDEMITKILEGAEKTDDMKVKFLSILSRQGLISY